MKRLGLPRSATRTRTEVPRPSESAWPRRRVSPHGSSCWPGYRAIQHHSGLRAADDRIPRDELLLGLQLAHLVADSGLAGPERSLPLRTQLLLSSLFGAQLGHNG